MSPEIKVNGKTIAVVPDETGRYRTDKGLYISINSDGIEADNSTQRLIIESLEVGGRRIIGLKQTGIGSSSSSIGDQKTPEVSARLINRPIRITYRRLGEYGIYKETYKNPCWQRNHGRR